MVKKSNSQIQILLKVQTMIFYHFIVILVEKK